jgi:putative oxidoreductase
MPGYLHALGRALISIVFIVFGVIQITNIGSYISNPAVVKFSATIGNVLSPTVIAYLVATIDLGGGLLLLIGWQVRWVVWIAFVFVALTLFFAHPFWTMEGQARAINQANFLKNLAIMGAMLLLAVNGAGPWSVDNRARS